MTSQSHSRYANGRWARGKVLVVASRMAVRWRCDAMAMRACVGGEGAPKSDWDDTRGRVTYVGEPFAG